MPGARTKREAMPTLLSLADALLETVQAWEIAAAVPKEGRLGGSRHDAFIHAPKRQPPATGPALIAAHRPPVRVTRRSSSGPVQNPSVARVPALPNPEELRALLHDHRHAYASTSEPERRVSRAHIHLLKWLLENQIQAWSSWTVETARGEVFEGPMAPIPANDWDELSVTYSARFVDEDRSIPYCAAELPQWQGEAGGQQVTGRFVWHGIMVDLDQFQRALGGLQSILSKVALLRPSPARAGWAVRVDGKVIPVAAPATKEGLQRGLKALWVLIRGPEVQLPYILLEAAARRRVVTRPGAVRVDEKKALDGLRARLDKIFLEFWHGGISDIDANRLVCSALSAQAEETKRGATSLGFEQVLAELVQQSPKRGAAPGRKTPTFATEARRTVQGNLDQATAAVRSALDGRLPGLPDNPEKRLGNLLDDHLVDRPLLWVAYAPPPLMIWRAE